MSAAAVFSLLPDPLFRESAERAVISSALVVLALWILAEWPGRPLGFGDVKLVGVIGMQLGAYGFDAAFSALTVSVIIGGVWAVWMVTTRRMGAGDHLAFGPFMAMGGSFQLSLVAGV